MSVFSPGDRASRKRLPDPGPGSLLALIAPAGYGKSALLASALGNRNRPALLLALQDWHGDVNAIHDALQRAFSPLVATANGASAEWSADNGSWMSVVWPRLRAALDKQPSLFMVDNLEQLIDEGARQALETVIRDLPDSCIVIVAGRRMPVGFGQATGRQVLELGDQFLTMSPSEVFDLFGSLDLNAEPRLHPLTLGWPAAVWTGVHLVRSGRPITVAALAERLKPYLEEEVFAGLPKATLRFLEVVGLLGGAGVELLDQARSAHDSAAFASSLEVEPVPMVVMRSGGKHLQLAPVLAHHLLQQFRSRPSPERDRVLAPILAALTRSGDYEQAFTLTRDHLSRGELAAYVVRHGVGRALAGRGRLLLSWLSEFTAEEVRTLPGLGIMHALAALSEGNTVPIARWVALVDSDNVDSDAPGFRAAAFLEEVTGVRAPGQALEAALDSDVTAWRLLAHVIAGADAALSGQEGKAVRLLRAQRAFLPRYPLLSVLNDAALGAVLLLPDNRVDTHELFNELTHTMANAELANNPLTAGVDAFFAAKSGFAGDGEAVRLHADNAARKLAALGSGFPLLHLSAQVLLTAAHEALGDLERAGEHAAACLRVAQLLRPGIQERVEEVFRPVEVESREEAPTALLTAAESKVLKLLNSHLTVPRIAAELQLSPTTVRSHTRSIFRKLGVRSRSGALAEATMRGLFD
jgi:LuxR family maltose regulon positive regulatory protein